MATTNRAHRRLGWVFGLAGVTGVAFVALILSNVVGGIGVHEVAGTALLVELVAAIWLATGIRRTDARPLIRGGVALIATVLAGLLGGLLADGALSRSWSGAPLLPIAIVVLCAFDGVRVSWSGAAPLVANG